MGHRAAVPVRVCGQHPRLGRPRGRSGQHALLRRRARRRALRRAAQRPLQPGHRRRRWPSCSRPSASAASSGPVGPGLPRRHVRLRLRPDRGRPRRVGARAALGRERRPPQGLRLQVHGRGHRHGGRRLRRRPVRRPLRADGMDVRVRRGRRWASRSPPCSSTSPASARRARSPPTSPPARPRRGSARWRRCAASSPCPRCAGPPSSPWPSRSASTPSSSRACRPTPSPCSTSTSRRSASPPPSTASSSWRCRSSSCASPPSAAPASLLMVVGGIWTLVVGRALRRPAHARDRLGALRHDVRHLRRRRDDVRPGAQPAHREPRSPRASSARRSAPFTAIQTTFSAARAARRRRPARHGPRERLPRPAPRHQPRRRLCRVAPPRRPA